MLVKASISFNRAPYWRERARVTAYVAYHDKKKRDLHSDTVFASRLGAAYPKQMISLALVRCMPGVSIVWERLGLVEQSTCLPALEQQKPSLLAHQKPKSCIDLKG